MPLAPMAQASQLDEADEVIAAVALTQRGYRPLMAGDELRVVIVRRKTPAIGVIIGHPRATGLFPEPVGNVPVVFIAGQIAHKTQHDVLAFRTPALQLILLFNGIPVEHTFLRLQLPPGDVHVQKRYSFVHFVVPGRGRITHQWVAESLAGVRKLQLHPVVLVPKQQANCGKHRRAKKYHSFFSHCRSPSRSPIFLLR